MCLYFDYSGKQYGLYNLYFDSINTLTNVIYFILQSKIKIQVSFRENSRTAESCMWGGIRNEKGLVALAYAPAPFIVSLQSPVNIMTSDAFIDICLHLRHSRVSSWEYRFAIGISFFFLFTLYELRKTRFSTRSGAMCSKGSYFAHSWSDLISIAAR